MEEETVIKETKECPACAELININAKKCKHCGEYLSKSNNEKILVVNNQTESTGSQVSGVAKTAAAVGIGGCLTPFFLLGAIIIAIFLFSHC
ncbi:MAG: hypothetical protein M0Z56_11460 [Desulfobacteraceae bacterium]|nr:hypothetical protein [Desulfobacteraceae bacterium]